MNFLRQLFKDWWHSWAYGTAHELVESKLLQDAWRRAYYFTYFIGLGYTVYGVSITDYLKRYDSNITFLSNFWPRLLFCTLPFILGTIFLDQKVQSTKKRIIYWIFLFAVTFHLACWVYVWPIILNKNSDVLLYINGINMYVITASMIVICLTAQYHLLFLGIFSVLVWIPLFLIAGHTGDFLISKMIISDTLQYLIISTGLVISITRSKAQLILYDMEIEKKVKSFAGSLATEYIYEGKNHEGVKKIFASYIDLRNSTKILNQFMENNVDYNINSVLNNIVSSLCTKYDCILQADSGDGFFIIKIVNEGENLDDLAKFPGIQEELQEAKHNIKNQHFQVMLNFMEDLSKILKEEEQKTKIKLNFGAGLAYGESSFEMRGNIEGKLKFDITSDLPHRSKRLEEYSKVHFEQNGCQLNSIVIQTNCCYFQDFLKVDSNPAVKDFPNIKSVFIYNI